MGSSSATDIDSEETCNSADGYGGLKEFETMTSIANAATVAPSQLITKLIASAITTSLLDDVLQRTARAHNTANNDAHFIRYGSGI